MMHEYWRRGGFAKVGMEEEVEGGGGATPTNPSISAAMHSWRLYDNPFYYYQHHHPHHHHHFHHHHHHHHNPIFPTHHPYNHARLPISSRRLAATLWHLPALCRPMDGELRLARARIRELRAELELERRLRRKAEALGRALAREASEERARREAAELEASRAREDAAGLRGEVEEERRMMRVAEALREERVQMKLAEARLLMEERLLAMESSSPAPEKTTPPAPAGVADGGVGGPGPPRREAENPHIKRGMKGFVEFPKVGRARAGPSSSGPRDGKGGPGPKLECQMAQLRVLLKHRIPVGLASSGTANLVM